MAKNREQLRNTSELDYQRILDKLNVTQERQRENFKKKLADPHYRAKQQRQKLLSQERSLQRQRDKQNDPEYRDKLLSKARAYGQRLQEKQRAKYKLKAVKPDSPVGCAKKSKRKGILGRSRTAEEKRLEAKIAQIGCICCLNQGWPSYTPEDGIPYISMHHTDGRVKPHCHAKQLPLCQHHHDTPPPLGAPDELFPLHGNAGSKKRWQKINGSQEELLRQVYEIIGEHRPWVETTINHPRNINELRAS